MKYLILSSLVLSSAVFATPIASGKITLPEKLAGSAKGMRTIFVSVYEPKPKGASGMPYGATKIDLTADAKAGDVANFTLDTQTMMMMTSQEKLPAKLDIKVKLDRDGSAGPDSAGDLVGWARGVKVGAKNLVVKVDQEIH